MFCGHESHQSARYDIQYGQVREYQSSSGKIVASGTGATGWASSIARATGVEATELPAPTDDTLYFMVREAWPSAFTGADVVRGLVGSGGQSLKVTSKMQDGGVLFGDGIESDALHFSYGQHAEFRVSERVLNLVVP